MADDQRQANRPHNPGNGGSASPPAQQPPQQQPASDWQDEVTIEIDAPRNGVVGFDPERSFLRGQWRRDRLLPDEVSSDEIKFLPDLIPGLRITLNGRTKEGRIWDPLASPEYEHLLERLTQSNQRVMRQPESIKQRMGPVPEVTRRLEPTRLKTWLYHMNKLVEAGDAVLVAGRFPSADVRERLPGKTEIECWAQRGANQKRWLEDQPKAQVA